MFRKLGTNVPQVMPEVIYPWSRFWVPRDGVIDLSDGGFLRDPTDWLAGPQSPVSLAALQHWRSLALLGEPGIGKSSALKEEADRIASFPPDSNLTSIYTDLRVFSSEMLLYQRVFESEEFTAWKNGGSRLFLHLDSLDEALLRIDSIANLLASELPGIPTDRLSIRIACRTAVWPANTLGVALNGIWGEAAGAFELAPLRRRDLFTALEANGIVIEGFMRALLAAQAVPFAIKPLTLKMLIGIYQQRDNLPHSNIDLYRQGCLALCEESNKSRRDFWTPRVSQRWSAPAPRRADRSGDNLWQPLRGLDWAGGRLSPRGHSGIRACRQPRSRRLRRVHRDRCRRP